MHIFVYPAMEINCKNNLFEFKFNLAKNRFCVSVLSLLQNI